MRNPRRSLARKIPASQLILDLEHRLVSGHEASQDAALVVLETLLVDSKVKVWNECLDLSNVVL